MKVTVLGDGAMGTACALLLAERPGRTVCLWSRLPENAELLQQHRENRRLLPGVPIPESIELTAEFARAVAGADILVVAIPTAYLRSTLQGLSAAVPPGIPVVSVVKGIENGTLLRPTEIIVNVLGEREVATLCGPSHAEEIARRLPASVVVASRNLSLAEQAQELFTTDRFRVYTNLDIVGVELAAAFKNVIAIAAGICDGLEYGDNAKAALVTRGIVEITRFGVSLGAESETFNGLAGLGDLLTTCFSQHSRNRRAGEQLGRGKPLADVLAGIQGVVEGVTTCRSVHELAISRGIELPIIGEVYRVLFEGRSPREASQSLMSRPMKAEG